MGSYLSTRKPRWVKKRRILAGLSSTNPVPLKVVPRASRSGSPLPSVQAPLGNKPDHLNGTGVVTDPLEDSTVDLPPQSNELSAPVTLGTQTLLSLASCLDELAPIPYISALTGTLRVLVEVVEKTSVNREQWKLLGARCIMVVRIAGAQVADGGREHYQGVAEATTKLANTIKGIVKHARECGMKGMLWQLARFRGISNKIENHFKLLDECLALFLYAPAVAQQQWMAEFKVVQKQELSALAEVKELLHGTNFDLDPNGESHDEYNQVTREMHEMLRCVLQQKSEILQSKGHANDPTYSDAERIVRTILKITSLELPSEILLGRQCIPDSGVLIKTGVTCDVYAASFLRGEKAAKKVFRIGTSERSKVDAYARRILPEATIWKTFKCDYILKCYGVGIESIEPEKFQLYTVSPLMKNSDAVSYLQKYKGKNPHMEEEIMRIITDAARGLQYLHHRTPPVVHSGVRGGNILITESGGGVLGGFGLTKALQGGAGNEEMAPSVMTGDTNSQRWMAPELFSADTPELHTPSDIWSWGMTALELLSGREPYYQHKLAHTIMQAIQNNERPIRSQYPDFERFALKPGEIWALLEKCWILEPNDRPTIDRIIEELEAILQSANPAWNAELVVIEAHWSVESRKMTARETFDFLVLEHEVPNLSAMLDLSQLSPIALAGGAISDVYCGTLRDQTCVAVKVLRLHVITQDGGHRRAMREIYMWSKAKHDNVHELMGVVLYNGGLGMVSLWMENGNMSEYIEKRPDVDRYLLCAQVASGVAYIHSLPLIHGDLKACNILISQDGIAKLSDFDRSMLLDHSVLFSALSGGGTLRWTAPELVLCGEIDARATRHSDVYALGMTMLEIITGKLPYHTHVNSAISQVLQKKEFPPRPDDLPGPGDQADRIWSLMKECWDHTTANRPSASQVHISLERIIDPTRNKGESSRAATAAAAPKDTAQRAVNRIIEEYLDAGDIQRAIAALNKLPMARRHLFVGKILPVVFKERGGAVALAEKLFTAAHQEKACLPETFERGFQPAVENVQDTCGDVPEIYEFLGRLMYAAGMDRSRVENMAGEIIVDENSPEPPRDLLLQEFDKARLGSR